MFFIRIPWPPLRSSLFCWVMMMLAGCMATARADWQLSWSDEFGGNSITTTNWTFDIGNGSGGWGNNELEYYTSPPQNIYVTNGLFHIVAQKESYSGFNYTSAKLKTADLFSQKHGRFEFYARLPHGQGYWPVLWICPRMKFMEAGPLPMKLM
jgi:beta-glucanase (GH16 family)